MKLIKETIKEAIFKDMKQDFINCLTPDRGYDEFANTMRLFEESEEKRLASLDVLKSIIDNLPKNRDWLDPDIEKVARILIKEG